MDTIKIGKYLAQLRHNRGLTQEALGEKLGVTYGVTINEILSGQKLEEAEYKAAAEENLKETLESSAFELKDRIAFFKRKWRREHLFELVCEILVILAVVVTGFVLDNGLQYAALMAGIIFPVVQNNRMMTYVEKRAFQ